MDDSPSKNSPGTLHFTDDGQICYVTDNLENKLKLSSPTATNHSCSEDSCSTNLDLVDSRLLENLETQVKLISQNVQNMIQFISNYTHSVTSLTSESVNNYEQCLFQTCDIIDSNIKLMYQVMSKYEELLQAMEPIDKISMDIKEIKRILNLFEKKNEILFQ